MKKKTIHNSNIYGSSLWVEFLDPFAVCIALVGCQSLEGVKEESWEELGPKTTKVVIGSQVGPN